MDLSAHFPIVRYRDAEQKEPVRKTFEGVLPDSFENDNLAPTLEWSGEEWDGDRNQLVIGRVDGEPFPDGEKLWNALAQAATSMGLILVPNHERTGDDTSMPFFDLEGGGTFDPQAFVNHVSKLLYGE
jgi:hypothetical protein